MGEDGEGTGSVEGHAPDSGGVDVVLVQDTLDRIADTTPYVICRLFLLGMSDERYAVKILERALT